MKKNETLKWDIRRTNFWIFCLFLVIFLIFFFNAVLAQRSNCFSDHECDSQPGKTCCSGKCVDLQTDEEHCGGCNIVCKQGKTCCDGKCVDLQTDKNHCGGCHKVCDSIKIKSVCNGAKLETTTTTSVRCEKGECTSEKTTTSVNCVNGCVEESSTAYCLSDTSEIPCTICDESQGKCIHNPAREDGDSCNTNLNCNLEDCQKISFEEKNIQTSKDGCLICEKGVCINNPTNDVGFTCDPAENECSSLNSICGSPCLVCVNKVCTKNKGIRICNSLQNQCDTEGKACVSKEKDTAPQTLTIDIARFVRNTVAFADLGSMAGTWLDKTLGISFFSTPIWGELEKTWPEGAQIFGGNWESSFCRKLWCVNLDSSGISGAKGAIGSHIEGEKLKISPELNLYKITFALNPTTESLTKQMNFTIELYDNSGNKEYLDLNNDKKPDTWINIKNKYATSKTNPIAFYSKKDYQKICLRFFNTNDYIKELRFALISNSNQLCNNFFDGDPSQNNMNINFGEIEFGGEVNGCANC